MFIGEVHSHGLTFRGLSLAGVRTSLSIPEASVCFDVAQGLPHAISMNTFLVSHGHMDHAAGIPYIISQKSMNAHHPPVFYMPEPMLAPMTEIMHQWSLVEGHRHDFDFRRAVAGETYPLKSHFFLRPFTTVHKIPSLGYSLGRTFTKLRRDLTSASSDEIRDRKLSGEEVTERREELLVSFTGDTQIEFLDRSPEVRNSRILIMEATYFDEKKPVASAREWGHTHFDEILERLATIKSEKILLIHSSARYSSEEVMSILNKKLPKNERERFIFFPGR
jgi:ribonuclease Z